MRTHMFNNRDTQGYKNPLPGVRIKTLVYGEKTLMTEFLLAKGHTLPNHAHPYEQTGYLVSGHMVMIIEDSEYDTLPGDSWTIHENIVHGARIIEDSVVAEVFAPVRKDYLPDSL